ncbi:transporter [Hymenobacter sp. 5317J-9]|uniref:transporter n=1 Tax=Hymenobacter sp. 5317J-9 TaxID=2932250 RepID=UPI001FD6FE44|nr:transporter [Hymenobacter sp. 5317J-9]UOQ98319.1 transporter [Hymenobacter sp. 5317J-9]
MKHFFWLLILLPTFARAQAEHKPTPYDSAHFSWRKPVPRNRLRELQPDRPGITESPFTVDAGHAQVEMDLLRLRNSGTGDEQRERELHVAYTMLKLGLSRRTDLQLEVPLYAIAKQRTTEASDWEERHAGFGDLTLRVKHNFIGDDQQGKFAMAVIGYARLPSGGAVGEGAPEYGVVLPVDIELSDKANLEAQLETDLNYDRDQDQRYLRFVPSTALEYDFTEKLGLVTEAVAMWNTEQRRWQASANIAPIFKLTPNLQLDLGTHLALSRLSDHEYFVGFTFRR